MDTAKYTDKQICV